MRYLIATFLIVFTPSGYLNAQDENEFDKSAIDPSIRIQDDLFLHVNGRWLKETEIPADKSNYGSFNILADQSQYRIRKIVETTAEEAPPGRVHVRLGAEPTDDNSSFASLPSLQLHHFQHSSSGGPAQKDPRTAPVGGVAVDEEALGVFDVGGAERKSE
ncbi:MAG: hypothetical protein AAF623_19010 [Planctomycetota bacterium]